MPRTQASVPPQIVDEASHWFVLMREPSISAESHAAFAEWLRSSPVNVGAYLEIARLWGDAAHIDPELPIDLGAQLPSNVISMREGTSRTSVPIPTAGKRAGRWAVAAMILVGLLAGGGAWWYFERAPTYVADVGELRVLTLEDGSTVRLNSRSKLSVHMSPQERRIELEEGQALFEVARDRTRPFIVTSANAAIRAVGTQFDVNRKQSGTVITVVEGRVVAETSGAAAAPSMLLSAGEQIKVKRAGSIERTLKPNAAAAISWLQQELIFDGQPLSEVVEELNRYSRTPIVVNDPQLAQLRINAVFHTTSPESFLKYAARIKGVRIERSNDEIRLSSFR